MIAMSRALLRIAAAPILERIRMDHLQAREPARSLLALVLEHLFDLEMGIELLQRRSGYHESYVNQVFNDAVGSPPYTYIEDRRMEIAAPLVADTALKVWQIAELLGYGSDDIFSRAFRRWSGLKPTDYRRELRPVSESPPVSTVHLADRAGFTEAQMLQRFGRGDLEPELARVLLDRLRGIYPETG